MATTQLNKTLGTPTNNYKWTISCWVKRAALGDQTIMSARVDGSNNARLYFNSSNQLSIVDYQSTNKMELITSSVYRDVGAFYNIVVSSDNSLGSPVTKMYVNGVETTNGTSTQYSQNQANLWNSAIAHYIGQNGASASYYNGLISYFAFVDGTAYDQSYFGETDSSSGIWKIKTAPSVTYGNNGFLLKMDTSSPGSDTSGNNNTFTASGTPTLTQDNASNNFCTLTPLIRMAITLNNGNTQVTDTDSSWYGVGSTMGVSSGKWYWEYKLTRIGNYAQDGVMGGLGGNGYNDIYNTYVGSKTAGVALNTGEGKIYSADSSTTWFGSANSQGQIIGVALDLDNNKIYYSQNGVFGNSSNPATDTNGYALSATIIANKPLLPCSSINNCTIDYNFGNGFFGTTAVASSNADAAGHGLMEYAVPTGFYTLNTKNLNTYG
tara:strand:- start:1056 stop:2363 length:1308 start_codon:yes stop_codon:yes gene_type:complete